MESDITGDIVFGVDTFLQTPDEPHYIYRVEWSLEDDEWVCRVAEFPSLSSRAADPVRALQGVRELVGAVVGEMLDNGERPPEPFTERRYSGRFLVRLSPQLHRRLTIESAEQGCPSTSGLCRSWPSDHKSARGTRPLGSAVSCRGGGP